MGGIGEEGGVVKDELELLHKTKIIEFLGRTTPIVLQNDNGPCPLLAICNVLLLKNNLTLSADVAEVSQEKLLSLVAERLIDSNSNVDDKDAGYLENQQQNIADAIDLLPRLTTGIDVNIKFTRIDDFEFTRECAIFDLLDIPLYHGWIVDPQDCETANAIGSKSYNTLMGELVALETRNMDNERKKNVEEDSVDFVAATTAALGVPSPSLSRGMSFEESPKAPSDNDIARKSDMDDEAELLRALKLSEANPLTCMNELPSATSNEHTAPEESLKAVSDKDIAKKGDMEEKVELLRAMRSSEANLPAIVNELPSTTTNEHTEPEQLLGKQLDGCNEKSDLLTTKSSSADCNASSQSAIEVVTSELAPKEAVILKTEQPNDLKTPFSQECGENLTHSVVETSIGVLVPNENMSFEHPESSCESHSRETPGGVKVVKPPTFAPDAHKPEPITHGSDAAQSSSLAKIGADSDSSSGRRQNGDVPEVFSSSADGTEPIYEGEECIESARKNYEDREPMYEGEAVLAKQEDANIVDSSETSLKDKLSPEQGELIRNFLKSSASQLTINGLFCLQDGLREREICVFFRNNHFNTMFKFEGELYILATDQGYQNQPDLVWEKLNEVNGNTVFMNSNFKEFNVETQDNISWNERNAVASTTDYIASIDTAASSGSNFNSDLQLAIALQQQEFEHQPQRNVQEQPPVTPSSRLVTGPQVPRQSGRNPVLPSRPEPKPSKDKCNIM